MNNVTLLGRLARDPELKTSGDVKFATFTLATNRDFKRDNGPEADFHNCIAFGRTGEVIKEYLHKGDQLCIKGRIENNNYEKDGVKHYGYQILVERMDFCGSKNDSANDSETQPTPPSQENVAKRNADFVSVPEGADEEMPFDVV